MLGVPTFRFPTDKTPPTPRAQDRRKWRMVPVGVTIVALGIGTALVAQWAVQNHRLRGLQFSLTWLSLYAAATLPNIAERSLHPMSRPRPRFVNSSIVGSVIGCKQFVW